MPLDADTSGTNADGSKSEDFCKYCFENGNFIARATMEEMIEICIPYMTSENPGMSEGEARSTLRQLFPTLKRWKQN